MFFIVGCLRCISFILLIECLRCTNFGRVGAGVGKHFILLIVLKPSNVTIQGKPNPPKINKKLGKKYVFLRFLTFQPNFLVGWLALGGIRRFLFYGYILYWSIFQTERI